MIGMKKALIIGAVVLISGIFAGCAPAATKTPATAALVTPGELILATTTSTRDSGLLDVLLPLFEKESSLTVKMVAVGSGAALKMGEEGNVDVLLVHAPISELELMKNGFGKDRLLVMHNDFILVGPALDPAGIQGMTVASDAFKKISETQSVFVSRGDDSGTHKSELAFWKRVEITPEGEWYLSTGGSMGDTLRVASEKSGYAYTDRATYLSLKDTLQLDVLVEGDPALLNVYHVITVNPEKWPRSNYAGALAFANFLVAPETQAVIAKFGEDEFGQPLFLPDAGKAEPDLGL